MVTICVSVYKWISARKTLAERAMLCLGGICVRDLDCLFWLCLYDHTRDVLVVFAMAATICCELISSLDEYLEFDFMRILNQLAALVVRDSHRR